MDTTNKKTELGITHKVVFEIPSGCHIEAKTSPDTYPAAIVVRGSEYRPGFFFHSIETGTYGPFDSYEEACNLHPQTDEFLSGWIVVVPRVKVEV